jgi:nitrile hydratase
MGAFPPEAVEAVVFGGSTARRPADGMTPRFAVGDGVVAHNIQPAGHTRLPRYARGKPGVVARIQGVFVFPDSNAMGEGEAPQYLYAVRFEARALWGLDAGPRDALYLDLWDSYLGPLWRSPTL